MPDAQPFAILLQLSSFENGQQFPAFGNSFAFSGKFVRLGLLGNINIVHCTMVRWYDGIRHELQNEMSRMFAVAAIANVAGRTHAHKADRHTHE